MWATKGSDALCSNERDHHQRDPVRNNHMYNLRGLIVRLDLDPQFMDWFRESSRDRHGDLDRRVLTELVRTARFYGYLAHGCAARTPLTGAALHAVRLLAAGYGTAPMCEPMLMCRTSVQRQLTSAKRRHGIETNAQLVAKAYFEKWLPDRVEVSALTGPHHVPIARGFLEVGDE